MSGGSKGDLISREALKKEFAEFGEKAKFTQGSCQQLIDHAPTVIPEEFQPLIDKVVEILPDLTNAIIEQLPQIISSRIKCSECSYYKDTWNVIPRPHGEREFIEILAQNVPEDLCTYPEYKGKPYYSIHYKENGEDFVGFGTYNPEVLSRYLRDYFMRGGADNE